MFDEYLVDRLVHADHPTGGFETGQERGCDLSGTTDRDGEADGLRQTDQHPPEQAAGSRLRREVGVQRVAGQQQWSHLATEEFCRHGSHGNHESSDQVPEVEPGGDGQLRGSSDRGERGQQGVHHLGSETVPLGSERQPRGTVAQLEGVELLRGPFGVAVEDRRWGLAAHMSEHRRRVCPPEPVILQVQRVHDRRGGSHGVEGGEQIGDKPGGHLVG